jgi:tRNA (mo5U34)-methyltransferase
MAERKAEITEHQNGNESAAPGTGSQRRHLTGGTPSGPDHRLADEPLRQWQQVAPHLPEDLEGWRTLDIGCGVGCLAIELARRGAHVTAIDEDPRCLRQGRWAARGMGLAEWVTFRQMGVYDLARSDREFDLVLFMGAFSGLPDPLLALDIVASRARRLLVFQSPTTPGEQVLEDTFDRGLHDRDALRDPGWPKTAYLEHPVPGPSGYRWIPSRAGVEAMLRSSGLRIVGCPGPELYVCEPDPDHPSCVSTWNAAELQAALRALEAPASRANGSNGKSAQHNREQTRKLSRPDRNGIAGPADTEP